MTLNRINQFKISANNYKIVKEINKGTFGTVYEVRYIKTGQRYAAKVIFSAETTQEKEMVNREIQIMMRIIHPTLIGFRGYSLTDFSKNKNITIFMDFIERGSLQDILNKVQKSLADEGYNNTSRQIILIGISYGMMILHQNYVIHRDLKPGNILIDKDFYPHITDFGLSKFIQKGHSKSQSKFCGTPTYMAPEVIIGERYDGKADVYSFGMIMYQIVTDLKPFPLFESGKISEFKLNKKIVEQKYRPKFTVPVKKSLKKLIERCWSANPKNRPTFEEIFNLLAYNRVTSIYDIFDEPNDEEEEEDHDDQPYYLNDVDIDQIFMYIDIITEKHNSENSNIFNPSKEQFDKLVQTIEEQQKMIQKLKERIVKNEKYFSKKIESQDKIIKEQQILLSRIYPFSVVTKSVAVYDSGNVYHQVNKNFMRIKLPKRSLESESYTYEYESIDDQSLNETIKTTKPKTAKK